MLGTGDSETELFITLSSFSGSTSIELAENNFESLFPGADEKAADNFNLPVYLGVRTCELFLCFAAIVRVRVYHVDFFVFFVLCHW